MAAIPVPEMRRRLMRPKTEVAFAVHNKLRSNRDAICKTAARSDKVLKKNSRKGE